MLEATRTGLLGPRHSAHISYHGDRSPSGKMPSSSPSSGSGPAVEVTSPSSSSSARSSSRPTLPPAMGKRVHAVSSQLDSVRSTLAPLMKLPMKETLAKLKPMERARLEVGLSFAINALFYVYLKTRGENPVDHPVKKELDTVKMYLKKLKAVQEKVNLRKKQTLRKEASEEVGSNAAIAFRDSKDVVSDRSGGKPTQVQVNTSVIQRTVSRLIASKKRSLENGKGRGKQKTKRKKRQVKTATRNY